jgi:medium-chain acyl-[acyl-carrier-protein] hydrolase
MQIQTSWFPLLRSKTGAKMNLFCLPPSGGGARLFRRWTELLPNDIDVYAIQLPGREGRVVEKPFNRMKELVPAVMSAILPHTKLPFAIFGHSMGGLVAFELARALRRASAPEPIHVFASAARAPHIPDLDPHHLLPDDLLLAELRKMKGFPPEVLNSRELMEMLLPTVRADAAITETYQYEEEAQLTCALTILEGSTDDQVTHEEIAAWSGYTTGAFSHVVIRGGHDFLQSAPASVVQTISSELAPHCASHRPIAAASARSSGKDRQSVDIDQH